MNPSRIMNRKIPRPGNKMHPAFKKSSISLGFLDEFFPVASGSQNKDKDESPNRSKTDDNAIEVEELFCKDEIRQRSEPYCEVRVIPRKGLGVVASIHIPCGTMILSESPLFILLASTPMPISFSALDSLIVAQGFSHSTKTAISQLAIADIYPTSTIHPAVGILKTNSLPVTMLDEEGIEKRAGGLFEIVCRINHSCVPNAVARWELGRGEKGEMRVVAKREIGKGEEITISYGVETGELREKFGFDCHCTKCNLVLPGNRAV